ncbi:MAG TPA: hypothetical protein VGH92_09190, partial [Gaiellaceae bacterium]
RWVYTLYSNPSGYPFIHALDTVRGVAHCVGIPMAKQGGIYNLELALRGNRLAVHWRSGRPFLNVNTTTWRVSPARAGAFPWWTVGVAVAVLLILGAGTRLRWRGSFRPSATKRIAHSAGG